MTYKEVKTMIAAFGLPYAYYQFEESTAQPTPFICFYYPTSEDVFADNINYQGIRNLVIELYTDSKDFEIEKTIEDALTAAEIAYAKQETHIDDEHMYEVIYTMFVVVTEEPATPETEELNG